MHKDASLGTGKFTSLMSHFPWAGASSKTAGTARFPQHPDLTEGSIALELLNKLSSRMMLQCQDRDH